MISGRRVARELTDLIGRRGKPDMIVSDHALRRNRNGQGSNRRWMKAQWQVTRTKIHRTEDRIGPMPYYGQQRLWLGRESCLTPQAQENRAHISINQSIRTDGIFSRADFVWAGAQSLRLPGRKGVLVRKKGWC